jgi:cytoskeleton protein RodZ
VAVVGKFLRQARENQKYTLEEVSRETNIDVKYLQALEEDRFDQIPSPFFVRIFLKNYAKFLGLNYEALLNFYEKSVKRPSALPTSAKTKPSSPAKPIDKTPRNSEPRSNVSPRLTEQRKNIVTEKRQNVLTDQRQNDLSEHRQNASAKSPGRLTSHSTREHKKTREMPPVPSSLPKRSEVHKKSSSFAWVWIVVLLALLGGGVYMYLSLFQKG